MTPIRLFASGAVLAAALAAAHCAPVSVTTYTARGIDVAASRTYAWERVDPAVPGDPRLDSNTLFHDYLRDAIDRQLVSRGYEPTTLQPDVYVHYHVSSRQKVYASGERRTDVSGEGRTATPCRDCSAEVYDEGTLLVDLTDARTGALVWRGVAESGLAAAVNNQHRLEETIERVVGRLFGKLPRRS
jgi:hypothetical protein